jgi:hypothetical protein
MSGQRDLVALRHALAQHEAGRDLGAGGEAAVVGDDRNVVAVVDADQGRASSHLGLIRRTCGLPLRADAAGCPAPLMSPWPVSDRPSSFASLRRTPDVLDLHRLGVPAAGTPPAVPKRDAGVPCGAK